MADPRTGPVDVQSAIMQSHLPLTLFAILCWTACILQDQQTAAQRTNIDGNQESSYFFYQRAEYPKDCEEVFAQCSSDTSSGVYLIKPEGYPEPFEVFCDNNKLERWTVILRRNASLINFHRNWNEYKVGFGFLSGDFWLGSEKISYLTNQKHYELRIDLLNVDGLSCYLSYSLFRTVDETSDYIIANLGQYSGNIEGCFSLCLDNMQLGDCSCQKTCENPGGCQNTCTLDNICVCSEGFYLKGDECVPLNECMVSQCIIDGKKLKDGEVYVNADCTMQAVCYNGHLTINTTFKCTPNQLCDERNNLRECYNDSDQSGCIIDGKEISEGEVYVNVNCTTRVVCKDGQVIMNGTFMCSSDEVCDKRNHVRQCYSRGKDCLDIYNDGFTESGVYTITPSNWSEASFQVYCNMTDGGGWTVFQRRSNGNVDFYRDWNTYKEGFGTPYSEHWLGNDRLYYLTNQNRQVLRIDFVNLGGSPYYAKFDYFRISNESDAYRLIEVGTGSGTAGAYPLINHRTYRFSTYDQDHDMHPSNCAERHRGAWWYHEYCLDSNLNGIYRTYLCSYDNIWWHSLPGSDCSTFVEMKIRPF